MTTLIYRGHRIKRDGNVLYFENMHTREKCEITVTPREPFDIIEFSKGIINVLVA